MTALTPGDARRLRWPLAAAAALALAGIALTVVSERQLDAAHRGKDLAHNQRVVAQDKVTKATDEERQIRLNLVQFQKMADAGMVGRTNRLNLIERIADIKNQRKLFEMRYNVDAQKPLDYPGIITTGSMDLVATRIQLNMLLLHEQDFLDFLRDLEASRLAYVSFRHCTLAKNGPGPAAAGVAPGLRADCTVDLINLVESPS
jgi:hypothetical protein